jgi:threonyl-tRNA synthetase
LAGMPFYWKDIEVFKITIRVKEPKEIEVKAGWSVGQILEREMGPDFEKVVAARFNGTPVDLSYVPNQEGELAPISADTEEGLHILRHSAAHIMAEAVKDLFPGVKVTIGPAIESGFYYDFDYDQRFVPEDLPKIEARMQEIIDSASPFVRQEVAREEALRLFQELGESYKVELLEEIPDPRVSLYRQSQFVDLCRGPHVPHSGKIKAFKLTAIAGAYWRGDERRQMLQRIYGAAFFDPKDLNQYLNDLEEARKRDHRKLGKDLDLFSFNEEAGAGFVIYHPKGALLRSILEDFERKEHLKRGYDIVIGPQMLKLDLWKKSGHFENYRENMYFTEADGVEYGIKPMNCVAHMLIYKSKVRSYRDLPKRYFELGTVLRHERSGVLHGLPRVRQFTQDDAHIICAPEQLNSEIKGVLDFVHTVMGLFGFPYEVELSTRPEKSIGSDEDWERATNALIQALHDKGLAYDVNEGDGAFYGPKIDIKLKDALNRKWQCSTIQCDFTLPERFDLYYVGEDNQKHRPAMIHRVILGSLERFIGVLVEHHAGAFPVWLAPVQVILLTVTDRTVAYAQEVWKDLLDAGIRVQLDTRNEKLNLKIREAQVQKIPYMLVIGDREAQTRTVAPRKRSGEQMAPLSLESFIQLIRQESDPYSSKGAI